MIGAAVVLFSLALQVTDSRILVWQTKVEPGQTYIAEEWGDLGKESSAQLVCRYFTGRALTMNVMWYSPNNIAGRDSCPFLAKP